MTRLTLPRICTMPGCGAITPTGGRCLQHRIRTGDHDGSLRRKRDGRNKAAWRRTREMVLLRAGHLCELQLAGCTGTATSVHKEDGGHHPTDTTAYLAACAHCHGTIDSQARKAVTR